MRLYLVRQKVGVTQGCGAAPGLDKVLEIVLFEILAVYKKGSPLYLCLGWFYLNEY